MTDQSITQHIEALVAEEQRLWSRTDRDEHEHERLEQLQVELDQCWDLLRQRRAREEFGENPDQAKVRPPDVVEGYEQ